MTTSADAWLEARGVGVPPSLHARMTAGVAVVRGRGSELHSELAEAALVCLRDALACRDDRAAALHLLAADALMTHACEAAAAADAVDALADTFAPDRLATLFRDEVAEALRGALR